MPLLLGQLVYTSFPGVGFKLLASKQVPKEFQQAFMQQVVYQYWDAYNPPRVGYRAAYIHQLTSKHSLFGWLYNDEMDDFGRCHVPYFLCYYLAELLHADQLENIFTCLHRGPVELIEQQNFPGSLEAIVVPDWWSYQPARIGVAIPSNFREQSHIVLQQRRLLDLFITVDEQEIITKLSEQTYQQKAAVISRAIEREDYIDEYTSKKITLSQQVLEPSNVRKQDMNTDKIEEILKALASKPIGIQGAVLVSSEGEPITAPIGMEENSALIMAGTMLYLAKSTREEFKWREIENISVRGKEGHLILANCNHDAFLLVKAGKTLMGLLDGEINRTVKKLQTELQAIKGTELQPEVLPELIPEASPELTSALSPELTPEASPELTPEASPELTPEASPELTAEVSSETENEIRYRGRPTSF